MGGWHSFVKVHMVCRLKASMRLQNRFVRMLCDVYGTEVAHALHPKSKPIVDVPAKVLQADLSTGPTTANPIEKFTLWWLLQAIEHASEVIHATPHSLRRFYDELSEAAAMRQSGSELKGAHYCIRGASVVDKSIAVLFVSYCEETAYWQNKSAKTVSHIEVGFRNKISHAYFAET